MRTFLPKSMWLAFAFATLVLLTGLAMVVLGASGASEFEIFGQRLKSANVGLTVIALSVLSFVALVRRVLRSYDELGSGRLDAPATKHRVARPAVQEIRETMGRLGEKIELVLSALRSPGTTKHEIENLHEQLEAYVNAHSLFLNQDLYPILSSLKDVLHDTVNVRIATGTPNARTLGAGVVKLIELRNQTMSKMAEMAAQEPDATPEQSRERPATLWFVVAVLLITALVVVSILFSMSHSSSAVVPSATPVVVEVRMPERMEVPTVDQAPVDAGPRTLLSLIAVPSGRIWIDGRVVGAGRVTRSVRPGRHRVAAGGSGPSTVTQDVDVAIGETRHVELAVNRW